MQRNVIIILSVALGLLLFYIVFDAISDLRREILAARPGTEASGDVAALAERLDRMQRSLEQARAAGSATPATAVEATPGDNQRELLRLSHRIDAMRADAIAEASALRAELAAARLELASRQSELAGRLGSLPDAASSEELVDGAMQPVKKRLGQLERRLEKLVGEPVFASPEEMLAGPLQELQARVGGIEGRLEPLGEQMDRLAPLAGLPLEDVKKNFDALSEQEGGPEAAARLWVSPPLAKPTEAMIDQARGQSPYARGTFLYRLRDDLLTQRTDPSGVDAALEAFSREMLDRAEASVGSSTMTVERLRATGRLPMTGAREAAPLLGKLLADESPMVRGQAALAAGELGDKRVVDALMQVAQDDDEELVRAAAVVALGELGAPQAIPLLRELKRRERSREVRARALESLRALEEMTAGG